MKTKLQILTVALVGLFLASCSTSMNMSKSSSSSTDDIYYTPSKTVDLKTSSSNQDVEKAETVEPKSTSIAELEDKYKKILASDTTNVDTLIYKAESTNPFERVLSDSYQDSYERRLKAMRDPRYGMESFTTLYTGDYWLASAYDPSYYNTIVMGSQVWVEPWYISYMFGWPRFHFGFGFNYGYWNWNPWYNNYYSTYDYYGWYGWNNPYNWGSHYYTNINYNYGNYYYGPRNSGLTTNAYPRLRNSNSIENQITTSRKRGDITTRGNNTVISTRKGQKIGDQEIFSRGTRDNNSNTTRLRGNTGSTQNTNLTEPTRRNNNTYQRPRTTGNGDGYIRTGTRNQNTGTNYRGTTTTRGTTTREGRNTTPTYNRPSRVDSSTERTRNTNTGSSSRESNFRNSGSSNSSGNSSTSSGSNQNNSSGGSSRRR